MLKSLALIILILLFVGCATTSSDQKSQQIITNQTAVLKTELSHLNLEKPDADVDERLSHGDKRLTCIAGIIAICPGLEEQTACLMTTLGYGIIGGTSDAIEGKEHMDLIHIAGQYAEKYNTALISRLVAQGDLKEPFCGKK